MIVDQAAEVGAIRETKKIFTIVIVDIFVSVYIYRWLQTGDLYTQNVKNNRTTPSYVLFSDS